jgi:putative tryptophan/tyrosine transport system substrate-binding protein
MPTRRYLLAAAAAAFAWPATAQLRFDPYRVGVLFGGTALSPDQPWFAAFLKELGERGYIDGKNIGIETRAAGGQFDLLPGLATELEAIHPDVIVATTTPSLMALYKGHCDIPVIFMSGVDPVQLGVAKSVPHPGGNYSGIVNTAGELTGKRLQILRDLLPQASRVACFLNPKNSPSVLASFVEKTNADASRLGFEMITINVTSAEELPQAFDSVIAEKADALLGLPDPVFFSHRETIIALAHAHKLPAIYNFRIEATDGGLIAYGADMEAQYRSVAIYVDKVLQGDKPADLPIEQASKLALVINLKTARALGLTIPSVLLAQADDVIE